MKISKKKHWRKQELLKLSSSLIHQKFTADQNCLTYFSQYACNDVEIQMVKVDDTQLGWLDILMLVKVQWSMYFVDQRKLELLQCQVRRNIFRLFLSQTKSAYVIVLDLFSLHLLKIELKWLFVVFFQLINYEIISPQFLSLFKGYLNTLLNTHTDLSFQINTVLHNFYRYGQVSKGLWLDEASQMKQKQRRSSSKIFVMESYFSTA